MRCTCAGRCHECTPVVAFRCGCAGSPRRVPRHRQRVHIASAHRRQPRWPVSEPVEPAGPVDPGDQPLFAGGDRVVQCAGLACGVRRCPGDAMGLFSRDFHRRPLPLQRPHSSRGRGPRQQRGGPAICRWTGRIPPGIPAAMCRWPLGMDRRSHQSRAQRGGRGGGLERYPAGHHRPKRSRGHAPGTDRTLAAVLRPALHRHGDFLACGQAVAAGE